MEKARLTREQAKDFEGRKESYYNDFALLVEFHINGGGYEKYTSLNEVDVDTFCRALYVGVEIIEEDQEIVITEKDRDNIRTLFACESGSKQFEDGFRIGVNRVLLLLGINIKGITEKEAQP